MPYDWAPAASSTTAVKFVLMSRGVSENVVLINYGVVTFTMNGKSSLGESLCVFWVGWRFWFLFHNKWRIQIISWGTRCHLDTKHIWWFILRLSLTVRLFKTIYDIIKDRRNRSCRSYITHVTLFHFDATFKKVIPKTYMKSETNLLK